MDACDRCTNLGKKILPILLPSMFEAEKFSDHPRIFTLSYSRLISVVLTGIIWYGRE